ncbi:ATP-dependent Clp protease proteolytic subunit [Pseudidiomarina marina]|uniref:SDH family Clp fold serine proteinase n=1 Tax=Pseudidiomarina marina TaxID=502366 RepID=UPI00384C6EF6
MAKKPKNMSDTEAQSASVEQKPRSIFDFKNNDDIFSALKELEFEDVLGRVQNYLKELVVEYSISNYIILFLFDEYDPIDSFHANKLYEVARHARDDKDILLIVHSSGGKIEPAYLISKTCKSLSKDNFVVAVPRKAKSAATLITLGADQIHMGLMSELGPIDPQINGYPALGLSNALLKFAEILSDYPQSSEMFALYLTKTLDLKDVGYFERVSESAAQYAERLLTGKLLPKDQDAKKLANHFVNHYKDHGFVIDIDECNSLLGESIIQRESNEYKFANEVFRVYNHLAIWLRVMKNSYLWHVGGIDDKINVSERKKSN